MWLRRTFASLLVAHGEDPAYAMTQVGHTTPNLTLSLHARAVQRRDGSATGCERSSTTRVGTNGTGAAAPGSASPIAA